MLAGIFTCSLLVVSAIGSGVDVITPFNSHVAVPPALRIRGEQESTPVGVREWSEGAVAAMAEDLRAVSAG